VDSSGSQARKGNVKPNPDLEIVIAREPLPTGRQGSNLAFFNGIATPAYQNVFRRAGTHLIPPLAGLAMTEWN